MVLVGAAEPASGRLVAIAEAHLDDQKAPRTAEISVSVLARRRRQGLGRRVVGEVLALARALGVARAAFFFIPENRALARLVRSLGGNVMRSGAMARSRRRSRLPPDVTRSL